MPEFYTLAILLINQLDETGEKQLSVFGSRGGQICPLMHVPLWHIYKHVTEIFLYKFFDPVYPSGWRLPYILTQIDTQTRLQFLHYISGN